MNSDVYDLHIECPQDLVPFFEAAMNQHGVRMVITNHYNGIKTYSLCPQSYSHAEISSVMEDVVEEAAIRLTETLSNAYKQRGLLSGQRMFYNPSSRPAVGEVPRERPRAVTNCRTQA